VRDVLAPVDRGNRAATELELLLFLDEVDDAIAPVYFRCRRDERDDAVADVIDVWRLLNGETVHQLHQHLRTSGLGRMNTSSEPIDRLRLVNEPRALGVAHTARICEPGGHGAIVVEPRNRCRIGNGGDDHLPSFLTRAERKYLHAR